jgi:formamidopyrimidine-DNA glycosylase
MKTTEEMLAEALRKAQGTFSLGMMPGTTHPVWACMADALAAYDQARAKCQTCGDTGTDQRRFNARNSYMQPCPTCSKPTGGTP